MRKNINRGYQKLRVWQDAIEYYMQTCLVFSNFPYELKRVCSQAITSSDSIHRNIAEGYCRRSINEYLNFINIALGSLGEANLYRVFVLTEKPNRFLKTIFKNLIHCHIRLRMSY